MLKLKFEKYHGLGNDFVIFDEKELEKNNIKDYSRLAEKVCHRRFGIGGDGILILKYVDEVPFMLYYNSDGSQAPMCGNGIRCFAYYLKNNSYVTEDKFTVKTIPGDMILDTYTDEKGTFFARVNMGKPVFDIKELINIDKDNFINEKITIDGEEIEISFIFMGTDHSMIFSDDLSKVNIEGTGKKIENFTELFPKKVNANFVEIKDRNSIKVTTWERGAGLTLACGTGATASAVLTTYLGKTDSKVNVEVPGGILVIEYPEHGKEAFMTGPSEKVAEGYYSYESE